MDGCTKTPLIVEYYRKRLYNENTSNINNIEYVTSDSQARSKVCQKITDRHRHTAAACEPTIRC